MADNQTEFVAAAFMAASKLAKMLDLATLEADEIDVTRSIDREFAPPAGAHVLSFFAPPVSIWIYVAVQDGRHIAISAMAKRSGRLRYYSFIYDYKYQLDRIEEVSTTDGRRWMLVITPFSGE